MTAIPNPVRVGLVTTDDSALPGGDPESVRLIEALSALGVTADCPVWHDGSQAWGRYELLVIRSTWDYTERLDEFLGWLDRVTQAVPVLNCPHLIRWNLDKHYLLELGRMGVDVIPTYTASRVEELPAAFGSVDTDIVVVKPIVSAGARNTGMFFTGDGAASELAKRIISEGGTVAVQPAISSVASLGERALVFIDGELSHAASKGPILVMGGGLAAGNYRENIQTCEPTDAEIILAASAQEAVETVVAGWHCECHNPMPLYSRFDVVAGPDGPLLLEAELFEPSLFLRTAPSSAGRFGAAVARRLEHLVTK